MTDPSTSLTGLIGVLLVGSLLFAFVSSRRGRDDGESESD